MSNPNGIVVSISWLKTILLYSEKTRQFLDQDLTADERMLFLKASVPELIGYISSAETILETGKRVEL